MQYPQYQQQQFQQPQNAGFQYGQGFSNNFQQQLQLSEQRKQIDAALKQRAAKEKHDNTVVSTIKTIANKYAFVEFASYQFKEGENGTAGKAVEASKTKSGIVNILNGKKTALAPLDHGVYSDARTHNDCIYWPALGICGAPGAISTRIAEKLSDRDSFKRTCIQYGFFRLVKALIVHNEAPNVTHLDVITYKNIDRAGTSVVESRLFHELLFGRTVNGETVAYETDPNNHITFAGPELTGFAQAFDYLINRIFNAVAQQAVDHYRVNPIQFNTDQMYAMSVFQQVDLAAAGIESMVGAWYEEFKAQVHIAVTPLAKWLSAPRTVQAHKTETRIKPNNIFQIGQVIGMIEAVRLTGIASQYVVHDAEKQVLGYRFGSRPEDIVYCADIANITPYTFRHPFSVVYTASLRKKQAKIAGVTQTTSEEFLDSWVKKWRTLKNAPGSAADIQNLIAGKEFYSFSDFVPLTGAGITKKNSNKSQRLFYSNAHQFMVDPQMLSQVESPQPEVARAAAASLLLGAFRLTEGSFLPLPNAKPKANDAATREKWGRIMDWAVSLLQLCGKEPAEIDSIMRNINPHFVSSHAGFF